MPLPQAVCVERGMPCWLAGAASSNQNDDDTAGAALCCWKQVCKNSFPHVTSTFQEENFDFRRLALGLYHPLDAELPYPPPVTFEPTLHPEDVFAVIELYRTVQVPGRSSNKKRLVTEASFVCPMLTSRSGFSMTRDDCTHVMLTSTNPYYDNDMSNTILSLAPLSVLDFVSLRSTDVPSKGTLRIRATLFRRDNMKSVCLVNAKHFELADEPFTHETITPPARRLRLDDENVEGRKAQSMLNKLYDCAYVGVQARLGIEAILPSHGSEDEPQWLSGFRRQGICYRPDKAQRDALSKIPHFDFRVKALSVDFRGCNFRSKSDFMIALEGLCWS